jgi:hypothetical protein
MPPLPLLMLLLMLLPLPLPLLLLLLLMLLMSRAVNRRWRGWGGCRREEEDEDEDGREERTKIVLPKVAKARRERRRSINWGSGARVDDRVKYSEEEGRGREKGFGGELSLNSPLSSS